MHLPWVNDRVEEVVLVLRRKRGKNNADQWPHKCKHQHLKREIIPFGFLAHPTLLCSRGKGAKAMFMETPVQTLESGENTICILEIFLGWRIIYQMCNTDPPYFRVHRLKLVAKQRPTNHHKTNIGSRV